MQGEAASGAGEGGGDGEQPVPEAFGFPPAGGGVALQDGLQLLRTLDGPRGVPLPIHEYQARSRANFTRPLAFAAHEFDRSWKRDAVCREEFGPLGRESQGGGSVVAGLADEHIASDKRPRLRQEESGHIGGIWTRDRGRCRLQGRSASGNENYYGHKGEHARPPSGDQPTVALVPPGHARTPDIVMRTPDEQ